MSTAITLTPTESKIQRLLLDFCAHYNNTASRPMVLRITGGWVRDKLMGRESHDLDVAINVLSGQEFVARLEQYLASSRSTTIDAIHTIKKNPDKSKHLETCTAKLFDTDIDFVNLRSETYTSESRIPVVEFGTAEEDALRRDATLNALFYNLNEAQIEDLTGRGLADLAAGILRTPLPPLQTFLDDPLRVLRLVRFSARFDFTIEPETLRAMQTDDIRTSLVHKISRERVGDELEKTLVSANPGYGLSLINYAGLASSVFDVGIPLDDNAVTAAHAGFSAHLARVTSLAPLFHEAVSSSQLSNHYSLVAADATLTKILWLAVILAPFRDITVDAKGTSCITSILKNGLRFGKHLFGPVSKIDTSREGAAAVLEEAAAGTVKRSDLGLYVCHYGDHTGVSLLVRCFLEILEQMAPVDVVEPTPKPQGPDPSLHESTRETVAKYEAVFAAIDRLQLQDAHKLQPILDGKTIMKELNKKPGPWMASVKQQVLVWQLDNPHGTQLQALAYVKQFL